MKAIRNITEHPQDDGPTCTAPTKSGNPCRGRPRESGFCFAHDPSSKDKREAARVKGGKNSSRASRLEKLMPSRLRPTFDLLETAMKDVYAGRLDPRQASAMASLAGAMVKVIKAGEEEASAEIPPQMIVKDLDKWYAKNRERWNRKPIMSWEELNECDPKMAAYEKKYGRNIIYPKEVL